jgi:acetyl-CoA carboxylase biotin carboxylase subunit
VFSKVLVGNRGEIAVRIMRACKDLGIATVCVCSEADRDSRAVALADESVCVGPAPASQSYLNVPAIMYACARTGADAVHPGYGFLSENPYFAEVCADAGVAFIGPPARVIALMGDKPAARRAMAQAGLPVPAGIDRPLTGAAEAAELAAAIGYPVVLKAAAGGGGRGITIVREPADLPGAYAETQRTARATFRDDRIYLEKFIESARHVEVQLLGDQHGSIVHLGERDCSIQRRRQKLVEESPSTALDEDLRTRICAAAVAGARAVGYYSAGTMEFLLGPDGCFYFMEMNTRIQVEHPVTEMRTGIDLVQWMIRVAAGERLPFGQDDIHLSGHAIECRINAEDPALGWQGFPGRLDHFVVPGGPGVRVDTHGFPGYQVPPHYDSLLAKVIAHSDTRDGALAVMARALAEFDCTGVPTTIPFHRQLIAHPRFQAGTHRLDFLETHLDNGGALRDSGVSAPGQGGSVPAKSCQERRNAS